SAPSSRAGGKPDFAARRAVTAGAAACQRVRSDTRGATTGTLGHACSESRTPLAESGGVVNGGRRHREDDREGGAPPDGALEGHVPAHHAGEAAREREPETDA